MVRPLLRTDRCRRRPVPPREQGHVTLKKAEIVADQIEQTIVGQRWEPGQLFGSEVELIARYSASRAVFRGAPGSARRGAPCPARRACQGGGRTRRGLACLVAAWVAEHDGEIVCHVVLVRGMRLEW